VRPDARLDAVAGVLDSLGRTADAEELYRRHVGTSKRPERVLELALFLGRHNHVDDALALCEAAWQTCPPEAVANSSVAVLRAGKPQEEPGKEQWKEQCQRVEDRLRAAARQSPQSALLPVMLAELQGLRGRHDEAKQTYRAILQSDPASVVALNNLAYLLAMTNGQDPEALRLVQAAIDRAGPVAELLDTRAVGYLKSEQVDLALQDRQQVIAQAPSAAAYFHLALAYHRANNPVAASQAFRKALEKGLHERDLYVLERDSFSELKDAYGPR